MFGRRRRSPRALLPALFCLAAAFFAVGGHWVVLQSVAWTRMAARFAETQSLGTALAWTFDGEHPCELCLRVRAGRATEERQAPAAPREREPIPGPTVAESSSPELLLTVVRGAAQDPVPFVPTPHPSPRPAPPVPPPRA